MIRGQIGKGDDGKIYAAALSPDNQLLAVGIDKTFNFNQTFLILLAFDIIPKTPYLIADKTELHN
jgi:hypothetical protein